MALITKLDTSVNDDSLLPLGWSIIEIVSNPNPTGNSQKIVFQQDISHQTTQLKIIGDGHFTDSTLSANNGKEKTTTWGEVVYVSNGSYKLAFKNDYYHNGFIINGVVPKTSFKFDLEIFKYFTPSIKYISASNSDMYGDVANLKNQASTLLSFEAVSCAGVVGDIKDFNNFIKATNINLKGTAVNGSVNNLSGLSAIQYFYNSNEVEGNISNFNSFTTLKQLQVGSNTSGDTSSLGNLTNLTWFSSLGNTKITGGAEGLANALWKNGSGKTSGTITYVMPDASTKTITFSSSAPIIV